MAPQPSANYTQKKGEGQYRRAALRPPAV